MTCITIFALKRWMSFPQKLMRFTLRFASTLRTAVFLAVIEVANRIYVNLITAITQAVSATHANAVFGWVSRNGEIPEPHTDVIITVLFHGSRNW